MESYLAPKKLPSESAPYIQYTTLDVIRVRLSFIKVFKVKSFKQKMESALLPKKLL